VTFPTGDDPTPQFESTTDGYRVTAVGGNITFPAGLAADLVNPDWSVNPGEALTFAFFESDGGSLTNPRTATNLEIFFVRFSDVEIEFTGVDGSGGLLGPETSTMGSANVDISALFNEVPIHSVTARPLGPPAATTTIPDMMYDHDCL